ncbi:HNH endonuclease [Paenibacillus sp. GSMTC-2017]|uniref:HNH endonuclease n=1 Tax=Paenibacillus sp. GSMTC-2017 TaxID=2794350 RepID=UPI003FA6E4E8
MKEQPNGEVKRCSACGAMKPLGDFLRRTGRRSGRQSRRGTCRACRRPAHATSPASKELHIQSSEAPSIAEETVVASAAAPRKKPARKRRRGNGAHGRQAPAEATAQPPRREKESPSDVSFLKPTGGGFIRMRGKTDNGRRWYQEIEPELAYVLVREGAAVVVNRHTIRRLYSNKEFRLLILTRDNYTCRFCGKYGDTIDHELPRAKGGHTTPVNCICACYECNQLKANRDVDEFIRAMD